MYLSSIVGGWIWPYSASLPGSDLGLTTAGTLNVLNELSLESWKTLTSIFSFHL